MVHRAVRGLAPSGAALFIVWIPMLSADRLEAAAALASGFDTPGVVQFYDAERRLGRAVAASLGGASGEVAWDVYLFYGGGAFWGVAGPAPVDWVTQVSYGRWVTPAHHAFGPRLAERIEASVRRLAQVEP